MNKFFIKPGKSNFKPLLAQKHQKEIFPQKSLKKISRVYATVISCNI